MADEGYSFEDESMGDNETTKQTVHESSLNALKYGGRPWNPKISAYTPLPHLFPKQHIDQTERDLRERIERFQRRILHGFTSRNLADMDVITSRKLKDSTLNNPIIPLIRQNRWESRPPLPDFTRDEMYPLIINGHEQGLWSMHNPLVYEIMKPALQIATRTICSLYTLPWFAALILGKRTPIHPERIRPNDDAENLISFHPYSITNYNVVRAQMNQVFDELLNIWDLKFGFMKPGEHPSGPEKNDEFDPQVYGITVTNHDYMVYAEVEENVVKKWRIYIYLNYEYLEPLFRNDLTDAERKMGEWMTAISLVHELIHAIALSRPRIDGSPVENPQNENSNWFFDQEAISEEGHSFEAALNGGTTACFTHEKPGFPFGYWFETIWPTVENQSQCGQETVTLTQPDPFDYQDQYPIPVSLYEDMQQRDFWDCVVHRFGHKLFHFRGINQGVRIKFTLGEDQDVSPLEFTTGKAAFIRPPAPVGLQELSATLGKRWWSIHHVQGILSEEPNVRRAKALANSLMYSSQTENAFWDRAQNQRRGVVQILDHLKTENNASDQPAVDFEQLITYISALLRNHERTIEALFEHAQPTQQAVLEVPNEERRKALLAWNRGTSIFINQVSLQNHDVAEQVRLLDEAIALEICRMKLFTPDLKIETINSGPDFEEFTQLLQLHADYSLANNAPQDTNTSKEIKEARDRCYDICVKLRGIEGTSLFAQLCTYFVMIWLHLFSSVVQNPGEVSSRFEVWERLKGRANGLLWDDVFTVWDVVVRGAWNEFWSVRDMS